MSLQKLRELRNQFQRKWNVFVSSEPNSCIILAPTFVPNYYIPFTISSLIFFASPSSIMVLSRKKSGFSTPA